MIILLVILSIPLYIYFIWGLYEPEEALLFGNRWRYGEDPEFSDLQLKLFKYSIWFGLILWTGMLIIQTISAFKYGLF